AGRFETSRRLSVRASAGRPLGGGGRFFGSGAHPPASDQRGSGGGGGGRGARAAGRRLGEGYFGAAPPALHGEHDRYAEGSRRFSGRCLRRDRRRIEQRFAPKRRSDRCLAVSGSLGEAGAAPGGTDGSSAQQSAGPAAHAQPDAPRCSASISRAARSAGSAPMLIASQIRGWAASISKRLSRCAADQAAGGAASLPAP